MICETFRLNLLCQSQLEVVTRNGFEFIVLHEKNVEKKWENQIFENKIYRRTFFKLFVDELWFSRSK